MSHLLFFIMLDVPAAAGGIAGCWGACCGDTCCDEAVSGGTAKCKEKAS